MLVFFSFTVISISMSLCYTVSAITYSSSADIDFTINPTINLTLSSSDLIISNLAPGNYADSNIVTVGVSTNAGYGYYLSATTNSNTLTNTTNNSYVFNNLSTTAGTASTLANITPGYWGYSYSTDNGSTWKSGSSGNTATGYAGLPLDNNDSGSTGVKLLSTDSYASSGSIKFKIGAKATNTQVVGTYTGTVNFYAVTNPEPLSTMQEFAAGTASTTCSAMAVGDTILLSDSRDNTVYTIGKLADEKCWMLDNLALDLVANIDNLNENNTNASNTTLGYLSGATTRDPSIDSGGQYATAGVANWTSSHSYSAPLVNMSYKDIVPDNAPTNGQGNNKVGGYYNYCAASAGSYCYGDGTSYGVSTGNATEDICPIGWRMPTGNFGEYYNLYVVGYNTYADYRNAPSLPLSGAVYTGSANDQGNTGVFWTSTRGNDSEMYYLRLDTETVSFNRNYIRSRGYCLRCILDS